MAPTHLTLTPLTDHTDLTHLTDLTCKGGKGVRVDTFAALVESIRRCTELRGDTEDNRAALIAEAASLTPREQQDMREHFDEEAARWGVR